jgi:drug/metabolite transporter (DMT)-like permease
MNDSAPALPRSAALSPLVLASLGATWLIWGSTYLVIRVALAGFAPYFMMATRFLCAGSILFAWQLARGAPWPSRREWANAVLVGTLMLGGGMGGVAYAEQTIPSGIVVAFIAVLPLLLVTINRMLGVRPARAEVFAVGVGFAGVLMLTRGTGLRASPAGLLAIAVGTSAWAVGSVLTQRGFALAAGATGFATEMLCGGFALLLISAAMHEPWHWPREADLWIAWGYLVIFGSLIAFSAYMLLLERAAGSLASSYSLVNPVVALALGVSLGGERVSPWEWTAAGVVLVGVVLLFAGRARPRG